MSRYKTCLYQSGLFLMTVCLALSDSAYAEIVINEVMYNAPSVGVTLLEEQENVNAEFLEIYNNGEEQKSLGGWRLSGGVSFKFPNVTIAAGSALVIASNPNELRSLHGHDFIVIGPWIGNLSNSSETIRLRDELDVIIDEITYADEGDWTRRTRGALDAGHRGWAWADDHDGGGKSLELTNPSLDNSNGKTWSASPESGGSPGDVNGSFSKTVPPLITGPRHFPEIPNSESEISITARVLPGTSKPIAVFLHYRVDGESDYNRLEMNDNGSSGDGLAGDEEYGVFIPPQQNRTVIEYFITASDSTNLSRRYPDPIGEEFADLLFQVIDEAKDVSQADVPCHYIVMTEAERSELESIGADTSARIDSQMNATFISVSNDDITCRYNVGVRNRGNTSRWSTPHNYRINFRSDEPWKGVNALALNGRNAHLQLVGNKMHQFARLAANNVVPAKLQVNGVNPSFSADPSFGLYAQVEVFDSSYARNHFPLDSEGNLYTAIFEGLEAHYDSLSSYRLRFNKRTNESINDYSDLQGLTEVLFNSPDDTYLADLEKIIDIEQWIRFFAIHVLIGNRETSIGRLGKGDDFGLYRGVIDKRFRLIPKDLDSVMTPRGSGLVKSLFGAAEHPAIMRFLKHPEITPRYFGELRELANTIFEPDSIGATLEMLLGGMVPESELQAMKDFVNERRLFVLDQIPSSYSVASALPISNGAHETNGSFASFSGAADAAETVKVLVNGIEAEYSSLTGEWILNMYPLKPGENRIRVQMLGEDDREVGLESILVRRLTETLEILPGNIRSSRTLTAEGGPYLVTGSGTVVREGATLTIEPGTTIYFDNDQTLLIHGGTLVAKGSPNAPIQFTRNPGVAEAWTGLGFTSGAVGNVIQYADVSYAGVGDLNRNVVVSASQVSFDKVNFLNSVGRIFWVTRPQLSIRNCNFPELVGQECIAGFGAMTGEQ